MGAYAPYDNASLAFKVYRTFSVDATTGNTVPVDSTETYTANIQLQLSSEDQKPGIAENEMRCKGRLLDPSTFSSKIKVGSIAECTVNGINGTLRLTDLGSKSLTFARSTLFQEFSGVFKQAGRAG